MSKFFVVIMTVVLQASLSQAGQNLFAVESDGVLLDDSVAQRILFSSPPKILRNFNVLKIEGRELKAHVLERDTHITVRSLQYIEEREAFTKRPRVITVSCSEDYAVLANSSGPRILLKRNDSIVIADEDVLTDDPVNRFTLISCETNPKTQQASTSRRVGYQNVSVPGAQ